MGGMMMEMIGGVGLCDWCGVMDHHLVEGVCGVCHGRAVQPFRPVTPAHPLAPHVWAERRDQRHAALREVVMVGNLLAHAVSEHIDGFDLPAFIVDRSLLEAWEQALEGLRATLPQAQRNQALCERK